jgi:hypothetical protein
MTSEATVDLYLNLWPIKENLAAKREYGSYLCRNRALCPFPLLCNFAPPYVYILAPARSVVCTALNYTAREVAAGEDILTSRYSTAQIYSLTTAIHLKKSVKVHSNIRTRISLIHSLLFCRPHWFCRSTIVPVYANLIIPQTPSHTKSETIFLCSLFFIRYSLSGRSTHNSLGP